MSITVPSLFSLVFIVIGAAILYYAIKMAAKARQSLSWPSTDGEIAHSAVLYQTNKTPTADSTETYKADISYRYKVNGVIIPPPGFPFWTLPPNLAVRRALWSAIPTNPEFGFTTILRSSPRPSSNPAVRPGPIFYMSPAGSSLLLAFPS